MYLSTAQKKIFSIQDFFSKCDQIRRKLRISSHLLKKSLMENFIFSAVVIGLRTHTLSFLLLTVSLVPQTFFSQSSLKITPDLDFLKHVSKKTFLGVSPKSVIGLFQKYPLRRIYKKISFLDSISVEAHLFLFYFILFYYCYYYFWMSVKSRPFSKIL